MLRHAWHWLMLPVLVLSAGGATYAQSNSPEHQSHILLDFPGISADQAKDLLDRKLGRAKAMSKLEEMMRDVLAKPDEYRDLLEAARKSGLSDADLNRLRQQMGQNPPELSEQMKKLMSGLVDDPRFQDQMSREQLHEIQQILRENAADHGATSTGAGGPVTGISGSPQTGQQGAGGSQGGGAGTASTGGSAADPAEKKFSFQWLRDLIGPVSSSSSLGKSLADLMKPSSALSDAGHRLPSIKSVLSLDGVWSKIGSNIHPSSLPSLPNWGGLGGGGSMDVPSGGGFGGMGNGLMVLVWLGVAAVIVAVAGRLLSWRQEAHGHARNSGWKLGPWPVRPDSVHNRKDVIKAFEYLSVLWVGPAARNLNHESIAVRLAEPRALSAEEQQRAAHALARVYELARYTPVEEALSDQELASARRDLTFLAGVASA